MVGPSIISTGIIFKGLLEPDFFVSRLMLFGSKVGLAALGIVKLAASCKMDVEQMTNNRLRCFIPIDIDLGESEQG